MLGRLLLLLPSPSMLLLSMLLMLLLLLLLLLSLLLLLPLFSSLLLLLRSLLLGCQPCLLSSQWRCPRRRWVRGCVRRLGVAWWVCLLHPLRRCCVWTGFSAPLARLSCAACRAFGACAGAMAARRPFGATCSWEWRALGGMASALVGRAPAAGSRHGWQLG